MYSAKAFPVSFLMQYGCTPILHFFSLRWGLNILWKGGESMDSKAFSTAKSNLGRALDALEDIVEEAQQNHHVFISQATALRRIIRAAEINLQVAEKNEQST